MQLKPDELPDLTLDEVRRVTTKLAAVTGTNSITSCEATSDTLTVGTAAANGTDVAFTVTANQRGTHYILVSANLSSAETVKGYIRAKVLGQPCVSAGTDRYDD